MTNPGNSAPQKADRSRRKRLLTSPLTRRILLVNIIAVLIPVIGLLYLGPYKDHLIAQEMEALRTQGEAASRRQQSRAGTDPAVWTRQLRRHFLTRWPGADLSALEEGPDPEAPGDALRVSTRLSSPHLAQRAGPHVVIRPPWLQRRDPTDIEVDSHRVHPVVLDAHHVRGTIRIALPPGAEVIAVPEPFEVTRDDWEARLTARIADDAVILEAVVHEHPGLMDATLQEARRNFIEAVEAARDQPVILRMGE